jgi:hypothetical protein
MASKWAYTQNQWRNTTKKSIRNKMKLSVYHNAVLARALADNPTDPDYIMMYNRYNAAHLLFLAKYSEWKAAGGLLTGDTSTLQELLAALKILLDAWVVTILGF